MTVNPGSLVTEDGGQDLSNKTLVDPTVTGALRTEINVLNAAKHTHSFTILCRNDTITPVANTPTQKTLTGFGLAAGTYNGFASINTTVAGSTVKAVATTSVDNSSGILWIYSADTTVRSVDVLIVQSGNPIN